MTGKRKKHSTTNLRTKQFSLSRNNASAAACKWAPSMQQSVQADHYRSLFQGVPLQLLEAEIVCLSSLRGGFPISSVYFYCSWHLRGARLPQHRHHRPRNSVSRVKKQRPGCFPVPAFAPSVSGTAPFLSYASRRGKQVARATGIAVVNEERNP